jgi:MFS family permease
MFKNASNKLNDREFLNILLFLLGRAMSIFGTAVYTFAMGLYVLKLTGSGLSFATTLVLGVLPAVLINPFAGVLADKINKKLIVVTMDALSGSLLIGLFLYTGTGELTLLAIYISTFAITAFTTIFNASMESGIPNMVTEDNLMNINSVSKIIDSVSQILGPMIGGIIFLAADIRMFILINGLSFLFSAGLEVFIDFELNCKEPEEKRNITEINFLEYIKDALKYMLGQQQIIGLFIIFVFLNFFISLSVSVPLPFVVNEVLRLNSRQFGMIQGAFSVGAIVGALLVKKMNKGIRHNSYFILMSNLVSISIIMIGLPLLFPKLNVSASIYFLFYCLIMILLGTVISLIDIPFLFIIQINIPDCYRGRVLGLGMSIVKIVTPIAYLLSGTLINLLPPYILPIGGGIMLLFLNMVFSRQRPIKFIFLKF